ncbi:Structural maintenance of chromosomes protein 4 [Phlyctochytrium bullatum]|nr:Structural maintenance of chromosomes protein 4 [Phlyctochytrium bullatum]
MLTALESKGKEKLEPKPIPTRQRLIISKLVLRNFKSYAGTIDIGPFHKSFTSIVGPNGSGKSNVIDALLFVFGFKARKLRQERLSDLIHNSANYSNLDSCGVEVHFVEIIDAPNSDAFTVVDGSELVISRTVEKGKVDKSTYRINGKASTFTEVTNLLKIKGVDLDHKRFLILQGEVESIALMKPKGQNENEDGLLEYLEDIIGTTKYKAQIETASQQLDGLVQERDEKLTRLRIVEKDKDALEV